MTKINWDNYPAIPGFDCVKWKRERQAQILQETEGMTDEEVSAYFRQANERALLRRKELAIYHSSPSSEGVSYLG